MKKQRDYQQSFFGADLVSHHILNLTFSADITLQIFEYLIFSIIFRPVIFFDDVSEKCRTYYLFAIV